jgi:PAS domain S-box-containing protein
MARVNKANTTRVKSGAKLKQVVAALGESQEKLRKMLESVTDGISVVDLNGVIIETNQRTVEMHGFTSKDELLGRNALELVAPRDHERIAANMRRAVKQGTVRGVEYTLLKANGSEFPGELSTSILKDASGNWIGLITIARDVTERKRAEEALADEVTRRRLLVDQSRDGIVVLDENAKVYEANQRFAEMLGYTPEEVRELHTWDWDKNFPPEKLLEMGRAVDEKGLHLETQHHRKDGSAIDVDISINGAMCGGQKLIFCVCRDITERKQAEEALQTEKNKLQSLIGAMEYTLTIQDTDYNIIYQNELSRIASGGDHLGEKCYRAYEGREKVCEGCPVEKAFKDGKSHTAERRRVAPSGEVTFWENTASPIRDARGEIISGLELARDITERKQAEEALKAAQEQLIRSEKLAAIGQLASGVGHELRNPLGAIKTAVHYVRRKIAGSELSAAEPRVVEFLGLIDGEVDSANKVITDLLSFSRVAKPAVSLVKVGSIIRDALNYVAVPGNVEVVTDVDPDLSMVMVDGGQIQQVFVNVILNALEAMPEGGRLEIRARGKGELVTAEFTDTGGGIPESVVGKIFEPLFTTKAKGIGLGLAMSKSIMERHGGDIGVKSKEGEGTTFTLSLPTRVV